MATFEDVKALAEKDGGFLAQLVANPEKALSDAKLTLTDPADIKRLELFVMISQEQVKAAGKVVGIKPALLKWGIGASCCNTKLLFPGVKLPQ